MQFHLLCVSKSPRGWVKQALEGYEKRYGNFIDFRVIEVAPATSQPSEQAKIQEAARLNAATPKGCYRIALDEHGKQWSSVQFANRLRDWRDNATNVACYIGGDDGLHPDLIASADHSWSLSALTLPHQLVRVVFAEQLYRAISIVNQHPYHRS